MLQLLTCQILLLTSQIKERKIWHQVLTHNLISIPFFFCKTSGKNIIYFTEDINISLSSEARLIPSRVSDVRMNLELGDNRFGIKFKTVKINIPRLCKKTSSPYEIYGIYAHNV